MIFPVDGGMPFCEDSCTCNQCEDRRYAASPECIWQTEITEIRHHPGEDLKAFTPWEPFATTEAQGSTWIIWRRKRREGDQ